MINNNVTVTSDINQELGDFLKSRDYQKIAVIVDENTEAHCLPQILESIGEHWLLKINSGETNKTLSTCEQLWNALTEASFSRKDLVINLGGGVIGDMGGFVASTYKRGIDFINLPSTLLSQVDASIGGKLGIDFNGYKNHIGIFREPTQVIVYPAFIQTLSKRELYSGFAEVIKHGLIKDAAYWSGLINKSFEDYDWLKIINHSIEIKSEVVENDPYEKGERKILNFGHTIGHAIETYFLETPDRLLHGEAIAVGMICEAFLSSKFAGLPENQLTEISDFIIKTYDLQKIDTRLFEEIMSLTLQDKKNHAGMVNYSLLKEVGECGFDYQVPGQLVLDSLFYFNSLVK
ncbi:MAG: 3-dehydroquinate synthase [Bacteroidota bacterium]